MPDLDSIGQALQGPLGGAVAVSVMVAAVLRGDLRLRREIDALKEELGRARQQGDRERDERQRYESMLLEQVGITKRVVSVAQTAVNRVPTP